MGQGTNRTLLNRRMPIRGKNKHIGLDGRIGSKFLHPGPGYGGSCFPKDTLALVQTAEQHDSPMQIVSTVVEVNNARRRAMADKIIAAADGSVDGKRVAMLGVTFKPNTDDMREAPSLEVVPLLREAGANLVLCDPEGRKEGEDLLGAAEWVEEPYAAVRDADVVVLMTEWNEFRGLDLTRMFQQMRGNVFVELRNVYLPEDARAAGFRYSSIGRK